MSDLKNMQGEPQSGFLIFRMPLVKLGPASWSPRSLLASAHAQQPHNSNSGQHGIAEETERRKLSALS
jgi:hypothetical protein